MGHLRDARLHSVRLASTRLGWLLAFLFTAIDSTRLGTQDKLMPQGQSRGARDVRGTCEGRVSFHQERKDLYPLRMYTYMHTNNTLSLILAMIYTNLYTNLYTNRDLLVYTSLPSTPPSRPIVFPHSSSFTYSSPGRHTSHICPVKFSIPSSPVSCRMTSHYQSTTYTPHRDCIHPRSRTHTSEWLPAA